MMARIFCGLLALLALPALGKSPFASFEIDRQRATVLIFPEPAHLAMGESHVRLEPLSGMTGAVTEAKVWRIEPKCKKGCRKASAKAEFILGSGAFVKLEFQIKPKLSQHVIELDGALPLGHIERTRRHFMRSARVAFLRTVRGWPSARAVEHGIPVELEDLAGDWQTFEHDALLVYVGTPSRADQYDIEHLEDPRWILAGSDGRRLIVVARLIHGSLEGT